MCSINFNLLSKFKLQTDNNKLLSNLPEEPQCINYLQSSFKPTQNYIIDKQVLNDLEIFSGIDSEENSIFNKINNTITLCGKLHLQNIINNPTNDITVLKNRQNIIIELNKNTELFKYIKETLNKFKSIESELLWLINDKTSEEQKLIDSVYFDNKYLKPFNNQDEFLNIYSYFKIVFAPLYGLLSPIVFLILPYIYLYFFTNIKFDIKSYIKIFKMTFLGGFNMFSSNSSKVNMSKYFSMFISFVIYVQNFMNTLQVAKNTNNIIDIIHGKLNKVKIFVSESNTLFEKCAKIFNLDYLEKKIDLLNNVLFDTEPFLFSNKGTILVAYNNILKNSNIFSDIFKNIGIIDSYSSILSLFNDNNENNTHKISYVKYLQSNSPNINVKNIWHPYLIDKSIITNDINIGNKNPNNIILTGPNAGGKSTFIKSITISLLFAQTLGISFAETLELTPFTFINTHLNIPDCKGKESLFEAEMHRARDHLNKLDELDNAFSFIVMDEIFSSTNPEEGISGAYAIAEKIEDNTNSIALITTHFSYLTK